MYHDYLFVERHSIESSASQDFSYCGFGDLSSTDKEG